MSDQKQYPMSVMLTCKDVARSVAFYRDVLGFTVEESFPDESNPLWANLILNRQSIMLGAAPTLEKCDGKEMSPDRGSWWRSASEQFAANAPGVGMYIYLAVDDVDGYHDMVKSRNGEPRTTPADQFYGIRDFGLCDPDGYRLIFYSPITMSTCQSCGMPLKDARPGEMYCSFCTDGEGHLKPYEQILEGTIQGFFMGMKKMERKPAEQAAKEHLAGMPAWVARS